MAAREDSNAMTAGAQASEIERLKDDLRREHDQHLRALADFENYRRRVDRDRASEARSGRRDIIVSLLELLDDFERALQNAGGAPSALSEGLEAMHRDMLGLLESQGVTPFESLGEKFNPALHEALGPVKTDEYKPGTVADEVRRGYRWGDELLRPARVLVAQ